MRDLNWAIEWQNKFVEGIDWYSCASAHSQPLNANQKAYAAWTLWTQIAAHREPATTVPSLSGWLRLALVGSLLALALVSRSFRA